MCKPVAVAFGDFSFRKVFRLRLSSSEFNLSRSGVLLKLLPCPARVLPGSPAS